MRESVFFEVRLSRFGVWRFAVALVAGAAIAAMVAWALTIRDSQGESGRWLVLAVAIALSLATIAVCVSLARRQAGVLRCIDGVWTFAPDLGARRSGTLEVAMDLGAFLLLRIVGPERNVVWLPVQRRGLEAHWHGLRCAVYSPPPVAALAGTLPAFPAE